ncbi:HEPN domain-containing protein [Shimia thalassica]|uniref:HEPN domain-containing protein n=1 Tax=Shimia thalassica TaxID=1715693 RepID=UPI0026E3CD67|nr:HEPN domain-containing protein [Shimia thalassica]MDO6522920.1 HEPN domain-containing protein [Shimia thalassica]
MIDNELLEKFADQFENLKRVVDESLQRTTAADPDLFFYDHQNVLIKSYLVSACSVLEAFIQDLLYAYLNEMQERLRLANLPHNLVVWEAGYEKAKLDYKGFCAKKTKSDVSDMVSPNYWKTQKAFERVGIDLTGSGADEFKDFISSTITKRNNVVHHNDQASDLSFTDIIDTIDHFKSYCTRLHHAVINSDHLAA